MNNIIYIHIDTAKKLTVSLDGKSLSCGEYTEYVHNDVLVIIKNLFNLKENYLDYNNIASMVKSLKSSKYMEGVSESNVAQKHMHNVRACFKKISIVDIIETIPRLGYKISSKWRPHENIIKNEKEQFLIEVRLLIAECIRYCDASNLKHDKSGLTYIEPDIFTVMSNFQKINRCYQLFIANYSKVGNSLELIEIRNKLTILLTYCIYWRVGDGLTDQKWKSDYSGEILILQKQIENNIKLITSYY